MEPKFTLIRERDGLALYRNNETYLFHLVGVSAKSNQVHSVVPGDLPPEDSGASAYMAPWNDSGIAYVSHGYTRDYLVRLMRKYRNE